MKYRRLLLLFVALCFALSVSGAELKLPSILGSHMVLQQNAQVNIWGWAGPGDQVEVTTGWDNRAYPSTAGPDGKWMVKVLTAAAGGPYEISVNSDTTIMLEDILLGEVWICSGQSNMEWPLNRAESALKEVPRSLYPRIRLFTVEKRIASRPKDDLKGSWSNCRPQTSKDFSAVGYFFGKELFNELNVPIGLIHTSWGGTPSESWTSREVLERYPYFHDEFEELDSISEEEMDLAESAKDSIQLEIKRQTNFVNPENVGFKNGWMHSDYDDSDWMEVECPAEWSTIQEIGMLEGVAWMRTWFELPDSWLGKPLVIELGPIDEMDVTYLNGRKIGSSTMVDNWDEDRVYKVPGHMVHSKENLLVIRIVNTYKEGGLFGEPENLKIYPAGIEETESILLAGEWKFRIAYAFPEIPAMSDPTTPTVLYNAMLHPLKHMTIKGAIWYQGESNADRAVQYRDIFPALIENWRSAWRQGDFPFYFVQVAPYDYGYEVMGAELREAQLLTLSKVQNTGMVVTMDIGNPEDIHPINKRDVGKRLALWALARDYGKEIVHSGPLYKSQKIEGDNIRILFDHIGSGLIARGGSPSHFEIAGADSVYYPARAIIDGMTVLVSCPEVNSPVAVRYGWQDSAEPNLFNNEGLPASSFCTDDWPRMTE